jgi:lysophospholipase L1-like esterase
MIVMIPSSLMHCWIRLIGFLASAAVVVAAERESFDTTKGVTQNRDHAIYDWSARHREVIELSKRGRVDVVMLGDSIIHYWGGEPKAPIVRGEKSWVELFDQKTSVNLGFGWDRVENVLWRVQQQEVKVFQPSTVVLMIGTNNLERNTAAEIRQGIEEVLRVLHQQLPKAELHVLGVLPRKLPAVVKARPEELNQELHEHLAGREKVHFHDLSARFLDQEGKWKTALLSDGLHPNEKGYEILGKALKAIIQR